MKVKEPHRIHPDLPIDFASLDSTENKGERKEEAQEKEKWKKKWNEIKKKVKELGGGGRKHHEHLIQMYNVCFSMQLHNSSPIYNQ